MARTKQTAKRSTGAPAPRTKIALQEGHKFLEHRKKIIIKVPPIQPNRSRRGDLVTIRIENEVLTRVLTVEVQGPVNEKADMDSDHDEVHFLLTSQATMGN
jgi:hypothetical protein